jgi:hypothetical protein
MRLADAVRGALAAALITCAAASVAAPPPGYGKVETFQPGRKYNCVPTADRKGWDCQESADKPGNSPPPPAAETQPEVAPVPATPPEVAPAVAQSPNPPPAPAAPHDPPPPVAAPPPAP